MKNLIKENRIKINLDLKTAEARSYVSPVLLGLYKVIKPAIEEYAKGKFLDIGCGDMPYKDLILSHVEQYDTLDIEERANGVKFIGSAENMDMIESETYDTAACFEVLEHVPDPFQAVNEIKRILKKDGIAIISVPHLSRLHEEPHDYYRYTHYGMKYILESKGFEILETKTTGSILSFLGHQISTLAVGLVWHIKIIKSITFFFNKWLCVLPCYYLDKTLLKNSVFPLGYIFVARKRQ